MDEENHWHYLSTSVAWRLGLLQFF